MLDAPFQLLLDLRQDTNLFYIFVAILAVLLCIFFLQIFGGLLLFWDKVVPACLVVLVTGVLAAGGHYFLFPDPCKCGLTRIEAFEEVVADHIWGQQVATGMVVEAMKAHRAARKRNPLVMSLHGGPGTGKTAMSMLLARSMFGHKDDEELGTSGVYVIDKPVGATREEYRPYRFQKPGGCGSRLVERRHRPRSH
ncbi:hypothetical protein MAR_030717 [Mya arenaria]|uniref:Uncharacterized protein n=1 Tax=Mya arenaria TaxID=6604 RepID=A0ABY7F1R0_MYAAR|nr:hypothetical protein MAR_030519 [Mya arenaria]WAR16123.1 hypothetical protein MAR_030717 [Mya arenaria]